MPRQTWPLSLHNRVRGPGHGSSPAQGVTAPIDRIPVPELLQRTRAASVPTVIKGAITHHRESQMVFDYSQLIACGAGVIRSVLPPAPAGGVRRTGTRRSFASHRPAVRDTAGSATRVRKTRGAPRPAMRRLGNSSNFLQIHCTASFRFHSEPFLPPTSLSGTAPPLPHAFWLSLHYSHTTKDLR